MEETKRQIIEHLLSHNNNSNNNELIQATIQKLLIYPNYPIVLVGGTNGKGSTCEYLSTILTNAGYNVGIFTSPHVFEYNERIRYNNNPITDQELITYLQIILDNHPEHIGLFKAFTLAAHLYFINKKIDIAIIEVGIGGAKDVTNLFEPTISAITTVELDHCHILGDTIEKIGQEKSGIYRSNKIALFGSKNIPKSVVKHAENICAKLIQFGRDYQIQIHDHGWDFKSNLINFYSLPFPALRGHEQIINAALSIAILNEIKQYTPVNITQIKNGLLQTHLVGRFQVMPGLPQVVLDTAHNPQAIETMCNNMLKLGFVRRNIAIFAIAADKDYKKIIELASNHFDIWHIAQLGNGRNSDLTEISDTLITNKVKKHNIHIYNNISEAFECAYQKLQENERLVAFGSFITVEQSYLTYKKLRK